jgi:hypothetical protein
MVRSGKLYNCKQLLKRVGSTSLYYTVKKFLTGDTDFVRLVNLAREGRITTTKQLIKKEKCKKTIALWVIRIANSKLKPGPVQRAVKSADETVSETYPKALYLRFGAIRLPECLKNNPGLLEYTNSVVKMINPRFGKIEMLTGEDKITQFMEVR